MELDNITFIKGYFDDVVKTWEKPIDILHIDGLHTYVETLAQNDFEKWSPLLKEYGVILMHDTMVERFGVKRFLESRSTKQILNTVMDLV